MQRRQQRPRQPGEKWERLLQRQHDMVFIRRMSSLFAKASLHGVNRICVSDTCCRPNQLLWSCILLVATVGLCVHIYNEATEYKQYPVSSSSRLELNGFMFPSVTFCNPENPIRTRKVDLGDIGPANDKLQGLSGVWSDPKMRPIYRYEHFFNFSSNGTFPKDNIVYCRYNRRPCTAENFSVTFDRSYGNCFTFQPQERHLRRPDMEFGLILILYNPAADMVLEKTELVGKMGYKMRPQEMAFDTESFLVNFHARGTIPHPLENSYAASMGMVTTLALEQMNTSLVSTPSTTCQQRRQVPMYDSLLQLVTNYTDTLYDCARWRDTLNMFHTCGCVPEGLVRLTDFSNTSAVPYCHLLARPDEIGSLTAFLEFVRPNASLSDWNISTEALKRLYPAVYKRYQAFKCFHGTDLHPDLTCPDMCDTEAYSAILSSGRWPHPSDTESDDYIKQAIEIALLLQMYLDSRDGNDSLLSRSLQLRNLSLASCHTNLTHEMLDTPKMRHTPAVQEALAQCRNVHSFITRHFLLVKVYPQTLTVKYLTVERSFLMPQLLSRIGGSLGLWIGTSLITFFECFEILTAVGTYFAAKMLHLARYHWNKSRGTECAGSCPYRQRNGRGATPTAASTSAETVFSSGGPEVLANNDEFDDGDGDNSDGVTAAFLENVYRETHV